MINLEIAVPTFNRQPLLNKLLSSIYKCEIPIGLNVLIKIYDNGEMNLKDLNKNESFKLQYVKNNGNIGIIRNIIQCFEKCEGDFLLVVGDDDEIISRLFFKEIFIQLSEANSKIILFNYFKMNSKKIHSTAVDVSYNFNKQTYFNDFIIECGWLGNCIYSKQVIDWNLSPKQISNGFPHLYYQVMAILNEQYIFIGTPYLGNTFESHESFSWKKDSINIIFSFIEILNYSQKHGSYNNKMELKNVGLHFLKRLNHFGLMELLAYSNIHVSWSKYRLIFFFVPFHRKPVYLLLFFLIKVKSLIKH